MLDQALETAADALSTTAYASRYADDDREDNEGADNNTSNYRPSGKKKKVSDFVLK